MEIGVSFSHSDLDPLSELPTLHLSALIQILLPNRLIEWKAVKKHYESATCHVNSLLTDYLKNDFKFLVTGSRAEGYAIPLAVAISETEELYLEDLSDVDILFITENLPVSTTQFPENHTTNFKAYLDYDNVTPGYARICIPRIKQDDESFVFDKEARKHYLSSSRYTNKLISNLFKHETEEIKEVGIHGPAITLDNQVKLMPENINTPDGTSPTDLVCALPCSPWPEVANSIKQRAVKSDWLQSSLVDSLINDGCHIVAVPSKISKNPELEWRLSFSASEGRLAREAVTDHQRQCYIYLKILRFQSMSSESVLSSYVFKSVFLHCCEQLPVQYWKDFKGNCLFYMLDVILECLRKKYIPTFFLPENNLVSHLTDDEIERAISTVEKLRQDPITPIFDFMENKIFACHCIKINFRAMVKLLLDDIKEYRQHRNKVKSIENGIVKTFYFICVSLLKEKSDDKEGELKKHKEAVKYIEDMYTTWIESLHFYDSLVECLNSFGLAIRDLQLSLKFFEAVDSLSAENTEFLALRGNLACMYHSTAYKYTDGVMLRQEYLNKASEMFKEIYADDRSSTIDYVTFLVKQKKFNEAMQILDDIPTDKGNASTTVNMYATKECETLEDPLKTHVQIHGNISGDSVSFAYFYMIKCLCEMETEPRRSSLIAATLKIFSIYCQDMKKENSCILLKYANDVAEKSSLAIN